MIVYGGKLEYCRVLNEQTFGPSVVFWVLPKGRNAAKIFDAVVAGSLPQEKIDHYFQEIRHLFDKRQASLDPARDARLSFTTSIGYRPRGLRLPAWKAVFFNSLTDDDVVHQLIQSIEDLM